MKRYFLNWLLPLVAFCAISGAAVSCSAPDPEPEVPEVELTLKLTSAEVSRLSGQDWVAVTAGGEWTLEISGRPDWVRVNPDHGTGNKANIVMSWDANDNAEARTCTLVLRCGGKSCEQPFTQKGSEKASLVPDEVENWMEIPAVDKNLYFFTHSMNVDGTLTRNYSFGWDLDNLVARWVAYPLNSKLIGSGSRTDLWGLDPKLPRACQPVVFSAFSGFGARGHQLPSADRLSRDANIATFYGTNMTPQDYDFNGGTWAQLENHVRDCSRFFDTLYVVTGCIVEGSTRKSYDNDGKAVTVPTGYFKALLGYKKTGTIGKSSVQGGYTATGYYFPENRNSYKGYSSQRMTIDELEQKVGMDFFVNLIPAIGESLAAKVESTDDPWWN